MKRTLIVLAVLVSSQVLMACNKEQVAACQATPGCVEAVVADIQARPQPTEEEMRWYEGVERARRAESADPSLHPFLVCVRHHESDSGPYPHANGYGAQNSRSTASGAYQFLDSTWRTASAAAGWPGWAKARYAPVGVQDAVILYLISHGGKSHWNGTGC